MNLVTQPTIFALSTGIPPAGIAVIRISGPAAGSVLRRVTNAVLQPRRAVYGTINDPDTGERLDHGLAIWFPGPRTATGEDLAELHLHGAIAIVHAVLDMLGRQPGLQLAEPGQFTRRALENGRIDLDEAEGLGDLLRARTEHQRRSAMARAEGALGKRIREWERQLLIQSARVEALLDFADEDDVADDSRVIDDVQRALTLIRREIGALLAQPPAENLIDGIRVVLAGPPNAGKSTLLNALVGRDAAIVDAEAGTTRDVIEVGVVLGGYALILSDTAGLREDAGRVEQHGIDRAQAQIDQADLLLWLGDPAECPAHVRAIRVQAQSDLPGRAVALGQADIALSVHAGIGVDQLVAMIVAHAATITPTDDQLALNRRQKRCLQEAMEALGSLDNDPLLLAESLRRVHRAFDAVTGRSGVEEMLDALFGQFCIGK